MYVYTYTYVYICIYICMCIFVYVCIYTIYINSTVYYYIFRLYVLTHSRLSVVLESIHIFVTFSKVLQALVILFFLVIKVMLQGFPGGAVAKNLPAHAGDTGSSPGPGRSHMPWSN